MFGKNIVMSKIEKINFLSFSFFFINITPLHRSTHEMWVLFVVRKKRGSNRGKIKNNILS